MPLLTATSAFGLGRRRWSLLTSAIYCNIVIIRHIACSECNATVVASSVCVSVDHNHELCRGGWIDRMPFGCGLGWTQVTMYEIGRGNFRASAGRLWSAGNIWCEPNLLAGWQQPCSLSLSVLQQFVTVLLLLLLLLLIAFVPSHQ